MDQDSSRREKTRSERSNPQPTTTLVYRQIALQSTNGQRQQDGARSTATILNPDAAVQWEHDLNE
jgi:hypothetical protein